MPVPTRERGVGLTNDDSHASLPPFLRPLASVLVNELLDDPEGGIVFVRNGEDDFKVRVVLFES